MKNLASKALVWIIWFLIAVLVVTLVGDINRAHNISKQIQEEKDKVAKMEADNKKLEDELIQAQSSEFIEKEVRNKLGLGKPGEAMVVLPDADLLRKLAPQVPADEDTLSDPNWRKWLHLFI